MKKYIRSAAVLILLLVSVIAAPRYAASAVAVTSSVVAEEATEEASPTPEVSRVEYVLPYPGMLPDNPLYFLKNLRDRIIEVLISDPVNKAEFYILQADKKLNMGIVFATTGKPEEAEAVLAQSIDARTKAVVALEGVVAAGKPIPGYVSEKLMLSLKKHAEVLTDLEKPSDAVPALISRAKKLSHPAK